MVRFIQLGFLALFGPAGAKTDSSASFDAGVFLLYRAGI